MKPFSPAPPPAPFFARFSKGATLTVRSGVQAGEYGSKPSEDIHKRG